MVEKSVVTYNEFEFQFTISLGLAEYTGDLNSYQNWIEVADAALYKAKMSGRNKVEIYNHPEENSES
jgi:diguanylate cyclase (GGDEF)-like protein